MKTRSGKKEITVCPSCKDVNYKSIWYAPDSRLALLLNKRKDHIFYHTCPACEMQNLGLYEGVLYVKDVPTELLDRVISTVLHDAERDYTENPQHRLLGFTDLEDGYRITSSSAAMVSRLGDKIKSTFNTCKIESAYKQDIFPQQITKVLFKAA